MLILKTKFDFMTDLMSTNENYSYLCDVISLLDMLQELKIKNFKSFRDEVVLSFETSGNDKYNSVVTMPDGVQLLRFAVVLGANASGKSNLLEAIDFLRVFWNKIPMKNDEGTVSISATAPPRFLPVRMSTAYQS